MYEKVYRSAQPCGGVQCQRQDASKLTPQIWKQIMNKKRHRGLIPRYDGPFKVVERIGEVSYKLRQPKRLKIHPTFHVSFLKLYYEGDKDLSRNKSKRDPLMNLKQYNTKIVKRLNVVGNNKRNTNTKFLIHWKGKSEEVAVWEKAQNFFQFDKKIEDYLKTTSMRASSSFGWGTLLDPQSKA